MTSTQRFLRIYLLIIFCMTCASCADVTSQSQGNELGGSGVTNGLLVVAINMSFQTSWLNPLTCKGTLIPMAGGDDEFMPNSAPTESNSKILCAYVASSLSNPMNTLSLAANGVLELTGSHGVYVKVTSSCSRTIDYATSLAQNSEWTDFELPVEASPVHAFYHPGQDDTFGTYVTVHTEKFGTGLAFTGSSLRSCQLKFEASYGLQTAEGQHIVESMIESVRPLGI